MTSPVSPARSVLITGASTGIGRASVTAAVSAGFHVWATVRREEDAAGLTTEFGTAVTPLLLDLLDHDSVRAAGERVVAAGPLHGLVNNAGVAIPAPLEFLPIEAFRRQLEVNLVGQLLVTQTVLPALLAAGDARIVFIGSISGRASGPILGAYSASKHGLVGMVGSLRAELAPYDVRVSLIEPGVIATPIWQRSAVAGDEVTGAIPAGTTRYVAQIASLRERSSHGDRGAPASLVASAVLRALTSARPRPRQVVGRDARLLAFLVRVLPFRAVYRFSRGAA